MLPVLLSFVFVPLIVAQTAGVAAETFHVNATATTAQGKGSVSVPMTIAVTQYTREHARVAMTDALKYTGYPGFLRALREAPIAGTLTIAGREFTIRWAHQEPHDGGRTRAGRLVGGAGGRRAPPRRRRPGPAARPG